MRGRARDIYARMRRAPILGVALSRLVWAAKGLMGRPVTVALAAAPAPPPVPKPRRPEPFDIGLRIALEAAEALHLRLAALEQAKAPPAGGPGRAVGQGAGRAPRRWSVIVPTLDRAAWLDRALWALAYQRHPAFEVIVVRGPCRDDTDAVLARHAARVGVVVCPSANIAAARNRGLAVACGDAVAFLDDDAVPEPDWLDRLGEALADPETAGVGGFVRDAGGVAFQCRTVVADRFGASRDIGARTPRVDAPGPAAERYLSLTGVNCGFRRRALGQIGGFDEAYTYFLDETDVCLRLVAAGWRLAVAPAAEVHHGYAESAQRDAAGTPRRLIDCVRSTAYFAIRHGGPRHGLVEAARRLDAYATGLARDTLWREDNGTVGAEDARRMLGEIEAGVSQGVHTAMSGPPRTMRDRNIATLAPPAAMAAPPVIRSRPERLRLALLCQDYPGVEPADRPAGGIAVWTQALAQGLARAGHEVSVFAHAHGPVPSVAFMTVEGGGLWVHRPAAAVEAAPGAVLARAPASLAAPAVAQAHEALRVQPRRQFDLAVGPLWGLEPAALLGRAPFPVAVSLHTACAQMAVDRPDWSSAYRRSHVDKAIASERRLLATAPHLLANSATALADLAARFDLPDLAARAALIAHGLPDLARGVAPAPRPDGVEFLFVGRLERRKGIDVLLEVAPHVLAKAPDARVSVVGEEVGGPGEAATADAFRRRHAGAPWLDRIAFLGPLPRPALLARYAACDVVLMPSRYESFGLVALEAMVFAKPCIAGDAGGLRDLVADGETGLRVAPGDPTALARAMLALALAPGRRNAIGAAARRRYLALYTDSRMVDAFEAWAWGLAARARAPLAAE